MQSTDFPVGSGTFSTYYTVTRGKFFFPRPSARYEQLSDAGRNLRVIITDSGIGFQVGTSLEINTSLTALQFPTDFELQAVVGNRLRDL